MKKYFIPEIFIILFSFGFSQGPIPSQYKLNGLPNNFKTLSSGLRSNGISEIVLQGESTVWLGTGRGVSYLEDSVSIVTLDTLFMNNGEYILLNDAISAIATYGEQILFACASGDNLGDFGTGIFYSDRPNLISDTLQVHHMQPMEYSQEPYILQPIGTGFFNMLPITTHYNNITYDLAVTSNYAWITSWAGGLRRISVDSLSSENAKWSPMPLPEDHQIELNTCDATTFDDNMNVIPGYFLNPRDPGSGGNHNHKGFSVLAYSDTVWVGTANGINRGIVGGNGCVDWVHYSYQSHNISGNFVVGLGLQVWNGQRIIWAATMNADSYGEQRGVSFTTNDGDTWETTLIGERVYNISATDSVVYASSENGLWKTIINHPDDPVVWALYSPMVEQNEYYNREILTDVVYTAALDDRAYFPNLTLWVGTPDGVARLLNPNENAWSIYQVETDQDEVFAYPNPFSPSVDNVVNGDGYIRFSTGPNPIGRAEITVYNFAMEKVFSRRYDRNIDSGELKWDGKDNSGYLVANGVYFVHLKISNYLNPEKNWQDRWIKIIVVK